MIPIKIQCDCGQKYAFDVEPVNGQMATSVACPACGADGTAAANAIIAQTVAMPPQPPPLMRLQPSAGPQRVEPPARPFVRPIAAAPVPTRPASEFNLGLGILGALGGALVGAGAMYGFYEWAGFRFPLLGIGIGVLTGFGARILYKGTDNSLGIISGVIAMVSVVGAIYLMYGEFPLMNIISAIVSISMAYRIAAR
jgi:hypothetical protein